MDLDLGGILGGLGRPIGVNFKQFVQIAIKSLC